MQDKCIVNGCENRRDDSLFVGPLCRLCHEMLSTGVVGRGATFVHEQHDLLAAANKIAAEQSAALGRAHAALKSAEAFLRYLREDVDFGEDDVLESVSDAVKELESKYGPDGRRSR